MSKKFKLGNVVVTSGVNRAMIEDDTLTDLVLGGFVRYINGDWGDLCEEDKQLNDEAVDHGYRLMGAYSNEKGDKIWIITEADRSVTTILLPEEY